MDTNGRGSWRLGCTAAAMLAALIPLSAPQARSDDAGKPSDPPQKPILPVGAGDEYAASVARGLRWLALHQAPDGHWSMHEFRKFAHKEPTPDSKTFTDECDGPSVREFGAAGTALALLPFLAAGYTSRASEGKADLDYSKTVTAGLDWLVAQQGKDGGFDTADLESMYINALAAYALCEAYGLSSDPALKGPAQKALNYLLAGQDPEGGGWRYTPKMKGDLSVTGWVLTALTSGRRVGLDVDPAALKKAKGFLHSCRTRAGTYAYQPYGPVNARMNAVGVLCLLHLGAGTTDPDVLAAAAAFGSSPPGTTGDIYYEYYATQALFQLGGDAWRRWDKGAGGKKGVRDALLAAQDKGADSDPKKVCGEGSWAPTSSFGKSGGRIMQTAMSLLILEASYHKLSTYRKDDATPKEKD